MIKSNFLEQRGVISPELVLGARRVLLGTAPAFVIAAVVLGIQTFRYVEATSDLTRAREGLANVTARAAYPLEKSDAIKASVGLRLQADGALAARRHAIDRSLAPIVAFTNAIPRADMRLKSLTTSTTGLRVDGAQTRNFASLLDTRARFMSKGFALSVSTTRDNAGSLEWDGDVPISAPSVARDDVRRVPSVRPTPTAAVRQAVTPARPIPLHDSAKRAQGLPAARRPDVTATSAPTSAIRERRVPSAPLRSSIPAAVRVVPAAPARPAPVSAVTRPRTAVAFTSAPCVAAPVPTTLSRIPLDSLMQALDARASAVGSDAGAAAAAPCRSSNAVASMMEIR